MSDPVHHAPAADATRAIAACLDTLDATLAKLRVLYAEAGIDGLMLCDLLDVEKIVRVARKRLEKTT